MRHPPCKVPLEVDGLIREISLGERQMDEQRLGCRTTGNVPSGRRRGGINYGPWPRDTASRRCSPALRVPRQYHGAS